jgi:hypothetical protein
MLRRRAAWHRLGDAPYREAADSVRGAHEALTRRCWRGERAVRPMPDCGAVHENAAAFDVVVAALTRGEIAWGRSLLAALRDHIWSTGEQISVQWLLPQVLETLAVLQPCPSMPTADVREEEVIAH